jgi:GT2 family glycosyltransferase
MQNHNLLTIGIPALNGRRELERLLESISTELDDIGYEVIVIDDGSNDGTGDMIKSRFPKVKYFFNKTNVGIARSTDLILQNMQGKYWLRLDTDTIVNKRGVTELLNYMDNHPEIGVLAPRLVNLDGSFQPSYEDHFKASWEWLMDYALWFKKIAGKIFPVPQPTDDPIEIAYAASAAVLVRKAAIDQIGGLDPAMDFFMEDADFIYRIKLNGWKIIYYPWVSIVHVGGQSGTLYIHTRDRSLKNLYYFYRKFRPGAANQLLLLISVIAGSTLSLGMVIITLPVVMFAPPKFKIIYRRALQSFLNVFMWHFKNFRF